ncbi:MAG: PepSY domain-containing protein [Cyclobacteriaceae bacterium]
MTTKKLFHQIHLWLGVIIGILFFIIAFSGAILSWQPELKSIVFKQKIDIQNKPFVLPSDLKKTMDAEFPKGDYRTAFFRDKDRTCEVLLYGQGTYYIAQLNPYTAELIHLQDMNKGWLSVVVKLHRNLMLGKFGRQVVHWVTLAFLVLMITGLVIWWPVNKSGAKDRLTLKWGVSPKKLNYDLHNVLGFYATWISIFAVVTGLFWGFEMVKGSLKYVTGETGVVYEKPKSEVVVDRKETNQFKIMDSLTLVYRNKYPTLYFRISNPHTEDDPIRAVLIKPGAMGEANMHFYHNRYTGEEIRGNFMHGPGDQISTYERLHSMVYDIHFGSIAGFPGRLLVFFATLIASSLPITGFIVWLGKRKSSQAA